MSSSLLKSFKEGVLPEDIKKNSEKEVKEVSAPKVEVTKEETELERLKRELEEARRKAEEAEGERDRALEEAKEAKKKVSSSKSVDFYAKDANICIRLNTARKKFCKDMSKKLGIEGGIGGYLNYLVAAEMKLNPDVKALAEQKEGKDFPYQSSKEEVKAGYDESSLVEKHLKK